MSDLAISYNIVRKYMDLGVKFVVGKDVYAEWMKRDILTAITTARNEEKEKVAALMLRTSIATGHGDTIDDLLRELEGAIVDLQKYKIAYLGKEYAMEVLFDRLRKAGVDYSDLVS